MSYMDKKDLKNKIESLYQSALGINDSRFIVGLDGVKSILGIDLNDININVLSWYIKQTPSLKEDVLHEKFDNTIPEAISYFNLESSLLEKDYSKALESVYYLSRVSEGKQILEFFLEFTLRYTNNAYREVWHILRLQTFLDQKNMINSLNRCVKLVINCKFVDKIINEPVNDFNWMDFFGYQVDDISKFLQLYWIYNSDLIRSDAIRKIILQRVSRVDLSTYDKIDEINMSLEQKNTGRKWILDFANNYSDLSFEMLEFLNNARGALISSDPDNIKYIWTQLNTKICN